jgi:hypothetical protein
VPIAATFRSISASPARTPAAIAARISSERESEKKGAPPATPIFEKRARVSASSAFGST